MFSRKNKFDRVKAALMAAGERGVANWDLNRITFRYSAVIFSLRNNGYDIETVKIGKEGLYKFIMRRKI